MRVQLTCCFHDSMSGDAWLAEPSPPGQGAGHSCEAWQKASSREGRRREAGPACLALPQSPFYVFAHRTGLAPPLIVKSCVACGLHDSHRMALVMRSDAVSQAVEGAGIRLPAVVQQFCNHGGQVVKAYVAGDKVGQGMRISNCFLRDF